MHNLTCPVFVTTDEHLSVHRAQRTRTAALVDGFEAHRRARLAEENRQVLDQLDAHIARLEAGLGDGNGVADATNSRLPRCNGGRGTDTRVGVPRVWGGR